ANEEVVGPEVLVVVEPDEVADADPDGVEEAERERSNERVADQPEQQQHHRQHEEVRRGPVAAKDLLHRLVPRARRNRPCRQVGMVRARGRSRHGWPPGKPGEVCLASRRREAPASTWPGPHRIATGERLAVQLALVWLAPETTRPWRRTP